MRRHADRLRRRRSPTAAAGMSRPRDPGAKRFVEAVSVPNIVEHQTALQRIATLNDDTREVFSPGYDESLDYVVQTLQGGGLQPEGHAVQLSGLEGEQAAGPEPGHADGRRPTGPAPRPTATRRTSDFITMANSPTVELTNAPVFPVGEIDDPPVGGGDSGCKAADYAGVSGKVALVQRGTCAVRREVAARAGRGRHRRDHLQRGQHARAPEPDLRRQPADADGDDRGRDLELHARQRAAAGLQGGQEPDRRLQGLRRSTSRFLPTR